MLRHSPRQFSLFIIRALWIVAIVSGLLTTSCVFLYVGGPDDRQPPPEPPQPDYVEGGLVGTWLDSRVDANGNPLETYWTFNPNGTLESEHWVDDTTTSVPVEATYELALDESRCNPGEPVYYLRVDGDMKFSYEVESISQDTVQLVGCYADATEHMTLVRVYSPDSEEEYDSPE